MQARGTKAQEYFQKGYSCAQSVILAFSDLLPFDELSAVRMMSSFGGGMARMREVCGAVSGAIAVLGIVEGYENPTDMAAKNRHYERVQEFFQRFQEANGSYLCRDHINAVDHADCPNLTASAADILSEMLGK